MVMGSGLSPQQEQLLVKHFRRIVIMPDGDDAGRAGTDDCLIKLGRKTWVRAVTMPDGKQPDQMDPEELAEVLRGI
jgi:DNA primase